MAKHRQAHIPPFSKIRGIFERAIRDTADAELSKFATEKKDDLVKGIRSQRFLSFRENPLNPEYKARKVFKGLDPRVLIATGHYVDSIKVIKHGRMKYEVNVPENAKAVDRDGKKTELPLRTLGAIHEYGSAAASCPPRRHWGVIIDEAEAEAPKVAAKITAKAAKKINKDLSRL